MYDEGSRSDVAKIAVLAWPKIELALKPLPKPSEILSLTLEGHMEGFHPSQMDLANVMVIPTIFFIDLKQRGQSNYIPVR